MARTKEKGGCAVFFFFVASLKQYDTSHISCTLHNKPALSAPPYLSEEGNVSDKTTPYLTDLKSTTHYVVPDLYHIKLTRHNEYNCTYSMKKHIVERKTLGQKKDRQELHM
jgi:hypothetical protein